jgi:hypothetical protein
VRYRRYVAVCGPSAFAPELAKADAAAGCATSTARAIDAAGLPAPTTTVRPRGGLGTWTTLGSAAAIAALKSRRRELRAALGSKTMPVLG